jgi:hypothetical protein
LAQANLQQPERVEYLEENLDIIRCFTFYCTPISEPMWQVRVPIEALCAPCASHGASIRQPMWQLFPLLVGAWKQFGYDFFMEFLPCISNFITRSSERFCSSVRQLVVSTSARARVS